ncbi:molecular chaperone TorD [Geovibrio sp. ADMFC3]
MKTLSQYMRLRADLYNILSAPFNVEFKESDFARLKKYVAVMSEMAKENGDSSFAADVSGLGRCIENRVDEDVIAGEFAKLFLGVNKASYTGHTITPHESVYMSESRLVMQEPWENIYEIYYKHGIGKNKEFKEPEDHITAEMSFMAFLSRQCIEFAEIGKSEELTENLETQELFLDKHLCKWIPKLAEDVVKNTSLEFYKYLSLVVQGFIKADFKYICQLKEELSETTC